MSANGEVPPGQQDQVAQLEAQILNALPTPAEYAEIQAFGRVFNRLQPAIDRHYAALRNPANPINQRDQTLRLAQADPAPVSRAGQKHPSEWIRAPAPAQSAQLQESQIQELLANQARTEELLKVILTKIDATDARIEQLLAREPQKKSSQSSVSTQAGRSLTLNPLLSPSQARLPIESVQSQIIQFFRFQEELHSPNPDDEFSLPWALDKDPSPSNANDDEDEPEAEEDI